MRQAATSQTDKATPASTTERTSKRSGTAKLDDKRPEATAQRDIWNAVQSSPYLGVQLKLREAVQNSPFVAEHRQRLSGMFGAAVQRERADEEEFLRTKVRSEHDQRQIGNDRPVQRMINILPGPTDPPMPPYRWTPDEAVDAIRGQFASAEISHVRERLQEFSVNEGYWRTVDEFVAR